MLVVLSISFFILPQKTVQSFAQSRQTIGQFINAQGNFQQLRLSDPIHRSAYIIKKILPPDAKLSMSPKNWTYTRCKARYALYPLELTHPKDWNAFLDMDRQMNDPTAGLNTLAISNTVRLFVNPEVALNRSATIPQKYPGLYIFVVFLCLTAIHIFTGILFLTLLKIMPTPLGKIYFLSTSYLSGFAILTLSTWGFIIAGGHFHPLSIGGLWGMLIITLGMLTRKQLLSTVRSLMAPDIHGGKNANHLIADIFQIIGILLILNIVLTTALRPVWSWDAMSHWIMKSQVIFHHKGFNFNYTHSNYYPLIWPLNVSLHYLFTGGIYDELAKWISSLLFLSFIGQLMGGLRLIKLDQTAIWILISAFLACLTTWTMTSAYAENALNAYLTAVLVAIIAQLNKKNAAHSGSFLPLITLLALGLSAAKLEGAAANVMIAVVIISCGRKPFQNKHYWINGVCIISTCLIPFLWSFWLKQNGYFSEIYHLNNPLSLAKIQLTLSILMKTVWHVYDWRIFLFLGLFLIVTILAHLRKQEDTGKFLLRTAWALLVFTVIAFSRWKASEIPQQADTVVRIFSHALPAMMLSIGYCMKNILQRKITMKSLTPNTF